ncbi:hypothetical protein ACJROX_00065 [Pseudalkalibacillus sp. A8]
MTLDIGNKKVYIGKRFLEAKIFILKEPLACELIGLLSPVVLVFV